MAHVLDHSKCMAQGTKEPAFQKGLFGGTLLFPLYFKGIWDLGIFVSLELCIGVHLLEEFKSGENILVT